MDKLSSYLYVKRALRDNSILLVLLVLVSVPRLFVGIWLGIVSLWTMIKIMSWGLKEEK